MMENKLCDPFSGAQMVAGVHGGGSPVMETITMMSRYDTAPLMEMAKYLAGINPDMPRYERPTATPRAMLDKFKKIAAAQKKEEACGK
jgi:4-hydroxyphenylacetate 3-monooxygenase/4-hydroxybutyryl-CoA dehydratase/vinylacetyl-CoA-Delta-isomerase